MMDLWTLFVENIFGGFWISVMGLAVTMFIIMALGGVSILSIMLFLMTFFMAMAMGYGYAIITVSLSILVLGWVTFQVISWIERGGQG